MNEQARTATDQQHERSEALQRLALDPQALISRALDTNAPVETLEKLVALAKDVHGEMARRAWYDAMAEFQRTCRPIKKNETAKIQSARGSYSYSYATLDEITGAVMEAMGPQGLSVSYRISHEADRVIATCRISHSLGHHEESGPVPIPIEKGEMGANSAQRIGIATSYAKRYSLLAITGLAPEKDEEAAGEAGPTVAEPRRTSEAPATNGAAPDSTPNPWVGLVTVAPAVKTGTSAKGPWTLWTIVGADGQQFGTFSKSVMDFAAGAGSSPVAIAWQATQRGGRMVATINPVEPDGPAGA